jgi:aspartate aminotransferase
LENLSLSSRAALARPSPTLAITAKARALCAQGVDVISLAAGEPDFNTPAEVCQAAKDALEAGFTKYTPSSGIKELKEAIAEKLYRDNKVQAAPEQITVSCGAKHSVFNSLWVLLEPGDEVILLAPYWMTYLDQIRLAGGNPVVVPSKVADGYVPDPERVRAAITDRTKAIIVNSPTNPTGAVYPRETLLELADMADRHNLWLMCDEIYERLIYDEEHFSIASLGGEIADRTITIGGCSKTYSMTGWRIGYAATSLAVAKAMSNFQDQVTSNPTSFAQKGAVAALHLPAEAVEEMRSEFRARRDLMYQELAQIPEVVVAEPRGAFYFFPDFSAYLGEPAKDDVALADFLLEEAHVATVPGSVFEGSGCLRLSYTASKPHIQEAVARMKRALERLRS